MALMMPGDEFELVERVLAALSRHADHDPEIPCRAALGNGLCYPVPASEQLIPWREALGQQER